jgi:hypothetical protein
VTETPVAAWVPWSLLIRFYLESIAKHLEPLKNGKIPVEILVTTKDAEEKAKAFSKCLDVIKNAGVSLIHVIPGRLHWFNRLYRRE